MFLFIVLKYDIKFKYDPEKGIIIDTILNKNYKSEPLRGCSPMIGLLTADKK